jgi:hypothetical protein
MRVKRLEISAIALIALVAAMMLSAELSTNGTVSVGVEEAQAKVGRPATPASVAGVARRATRRGAAGATAAGAAHARCGFLPLPPCY